MKSFFSRELFPRLNMFLFVLLVPFFLLACNDNPAEGQDVQWTTKTIAKEVPAKPSIEQKYPVGARLLLKSGFQAHYAGREPVILQRKKVVSSFRVAYVPKQYLPGEPCKLPMETGAKVLGHGNNMIVLYVEHSAEGINFCPSGHPASVSGDAFMGPNKWIVPLRN